MSSDFSNFMNELSDSEDLEYTENMKFDFDQFNQTNVKEFNLN